MLYIWNYTHGNDTHIKWYTWHWYTTLCGYQNLWHLAGGTTTHQIDCQRLISYFYGYLIVGHKALLSILISAAGDISRVWLRWKCLNRQPVQSLVEIVINFEIGSQYNLWWKYLSMFKSAASAIFGGEIVISFEISGCNWCLVLREGSVLRFCTFWLSPNVCTVHCVYPPCALCTVYPLFTHCVHRVFWSIVYIIFISALGFPTFSQQL